LNKKIFTPFFISIIICSLVFTASINLSSAQSGLVVYINSDTTWTIANSPVTFTGPTVVNTGVTLTINSGVTVNLNGYTLYVNGTLHAAGTSSENVVINGQTINFGDSASNLSTFEYTIINPTITSTKTATFNHDTIKSAVTVGDSSIFTNNLISNSTNTGKTSTLASNTIKGDINLGDSSTLDSNTISGVIHAGKNTQVTNNRINGSNPIVSLGGIVGYTLALYVSNQSVISNNEISGGVYANASTISNNVISGGCPFGDWVGRPEDATSALAVSGNSTVTSNAIYSKTGGYGLLISEGPATVSGNAIRSGLRIAGDSVVDGNFLDSCGIQVGDIYIQAFNDIDYGKGNSIIKNNIINGTYYGVFSNFAGGSALIQNNLVSNCSYAISLKSQATVQNNTLYNSTVPISLNQNALVASINYNNLIQYSGNSVTLNSYPSSVDATYNWWGSTDTQAIGLSIHDSKYDLNLGTVTYIPILNALNPQAPSTTYTLNVPAFTEPNPIITPTPTVTPTQTPHTSTPTPTPSTSTPTATESSGPGNQFSSEIIQNLPWIALVSSLIVVIVVLVFVITRKKKPMQT
jgi:hypothetical protein